MTLDECLGNGQCLHFVTTLLCFYVGQTNWEFPMIAYTHVHGGAEGVLLVHYVVYHGRVVLLSGYPDQTKQNVRHQTVGVGLGEKL